MPDPIELAAAVLGDQAERDVPLGPFTTYRLGGPAALVVKVASDDDLLACHRAVVETDIPVLVIGNGSNLLVADDGFDGLVLVLGAAYSFVEIEGTKVRAGAATPLPVLARKTAGASLTGLEWAVGVPGTVGGAVRMNAGGHGSDIEKTLDCISSIDLRSGVISNRRASELGYGYRTSNVTSDEVVTRASFVIEEGDRTAAEAQISEIVRWRREHQPGGRNAGSVFTNPVGDSAGRLIDAAGLKGFRIRSAEVSRKHANFVQGDEGGNARDVVDLIFEVQKRVAEATGVWLEPEVRMIGFSDHERSNAAPRAR